ncbi:FtsX-like permease family protein [Streptomyces sp. NPDC014891]|uniref:FtsX-like permease family protein n=1 Tax=Streptomyces sp. NPDC014891 TaxID=3364929 RepID=UPI0036FAABE8
MNAFSLALRLLWGGGRRGRVRFLLMVMGSALGVACLAAVLTIPSILAAHDARTAAREPNPGKSNTVYQELREPYGSQPLHRVFVARTGPGGSPLPPGVAQLPDAGEAIVSPKLREILIMNPGAAGLIPARVTGTIAPQGLGGPDDLYAYIGANADTLTAPQRLGSFGASRPGRQVVEPSTLSILRFTLACIVLLPLVIFLSVCARLSGESRARRLAALRLIGLSAKDTLRVNAGESAAAAFLGAALGVVAYLGVNEVMAQVGLPGLHWYRVDGQPSIATVSVCLLGCPALAWFVGQFSGRRAALSPISVRRTDEPTPPKRFGMLLLVPGLGIIGGYCMLSVLGQDPSGGSASSLLIPGAVGMTGAGLVFGLAPITAWLARRMARSAQWLPMVLAMRRTEVDPGASLRVATGLVLLVFGASLTQGVLVELDQVNRSTSPVQEYSMPFTQLRSHQQKDTVRVTQVQAHAMASASWRDPSGAHAPRTMAVFATCQQLGRFVEKAEGCVENKVLRIRDHNFSIDSDANPGRSFPFLLSDGRKLDVTVPDASVSVRAYQPSSFSGPSLLIPPSMIPPGTVPSEGNLVLLSDSDPETVRAVLDGIGAVAPTSPVEPVGIVIDSLAQLTVIRSLLAVGMVLGLVIGVAAFVVSVADRALERRAQVTALALLGARAGTLRGVQVLQVVLPLAVGLGGAVVAGWLAESSYLITGGGAVHWDWEGLPLLVAAALGVLLVAALASIPMVRRHVDPEHIRRD